MIQSLLKVIWYVTSCYSYGLFSWFQSGSSPLLVASYKGNAEIVRTLLKYHARVDVFDEVLSGLVT